jgi:hypothetical protein
MMPVTINLVERFKLNEDKIQEDEQKEGIEQNLLLNISADTGKESSLGPTSMN